MGTVWAQRRGLLAAFVNAAAAVGAGGWCDFALSLSEERRNSIFLSFFHKCFDCIASLDLV